MGIRYLDETSVQPTGRIRYLEEISTKPEPIKSSGGISSGFDPNKLAQIKKTIPSLLFGYKKTEEMIANRPDAGQELISSLRQRAKNPLLETMLKPLTAGFSPVADPLLTMQAIAPVYQKAESAIANPLMRMQEEKDKGAFDLMGESIKGLTGERKGQMGDIIRRAIGTSGKPYDPRELIAGGIGITSMIVLTNLGNKVIQFAKTKIPEIMTPNWMEKQATLTRKVSGNLRTIINQEYGKVHDIIDDIPYDYSKLDDMLLNSNLDDVVIADMDKLVGKPDTVGKAQMVYDIVKKRTPDAFFTERGMRGKGGFMNVKIRQKNLLSEIKETMYEAVKKVDEPAGIEFEKLDKFAHDKLYPRLDLLEPLTGQGKIPRTEGVKDIFYSPFGKATQRKIIKELPKTVREYSRKITKNTTDEMLSLIKDSKQLIKNIGKFQTRRNIKWAGATIGVSYILKKLGRAMSR